MDYEQIVRDIAEDITEDTGCQKRDRIKWVRAYSWWSDCVDELGYDRAAEILAEV